jgi:hypothetical protein
VPRLRRQACAVLATTLGAAALMPPAITAAQDVPDLPEPVAAGALPTPQTDGIVFDVTIVGDTVYAGGQFDNARPHGAAPGEDEVPRRNLLAFDLRTGELLDWAPTVTAPEINSGEQPWCRPTGNGRWTCDSVYRIEADPAADTLYIAGDFDRINGQWRSHLAAFDLESGDLTSFQPPAISSRVRALSVTHEAVYLGGWFSTVGGQSRDNLAALGHDGALLDWAPSANSEVWALAADPARDRVVVGGRFSQVNGEDRRSLTAVDATDGVNAPWESDVVHDRDVVSDLVTDGDGTVYASSWNFGASGANRFEGRAAFDITTGQAHWWDGCLGDTIRIALAADVLYSVSHTHDCWAVEAVPERGADYRFFRLLAQTTEAVRQAPRDRNHVSRGDPIPEILPWFPNTNAGGDVFGNGTWAIDASEDYVVVGGSFTGVNTHSRDSQS